jgi:hypothetical protein
LLRQNISSNLPSLSRKPKSSNNNNSSKSKAKSKAKRGAAQTTAATEGGEGGECGEGDSNIQIKTLDWETDEVAGLLPGGGSFDAVIACDCIYNDALIEPLVQACVDACRLRERERNAHRDGDDTTATASNSANGSNAQTNSGSGGSGTEGLGNVEGKTVCIIAQQLRSDQVFEGWLTAFKESFRVWRVPDEVAGVGLRGGEGFVVHVGVLR